MTTIAALHSVALGPVPGPGVGTPAIRYAGFWLRANALVIDGLIMLLLIVGMFAASIAAGAPYGVGIHNSAARLHVRGGTLPLSAIAEPRMEVVRQGAETITTETTSKSIGLQTIHAVIVRTTDGQGRVTSTNISVSNYPSLLGMTLVIGLWLAYTSLLEASPLRATLGKRMLSLRVGDVHGNRLGLARAFARNILKWVSTAILLVGFMMAGWTRKKQTLHDMIVRAQVDVRP